MRILHLTAFLQGSAGFVTARLAAAQRRAGHDVTLVASRTEPPGYGNYPQYLTDLAASAVPVHLVDSLFKRDAAANNAVLEYVRSSFDGPFDIVHAHAAVPARIGLSLTVTSPSTRVLQTMHGWGTAKSPEQAESDLDALNRLPRVIVPSHLSTKVLAWMGVDASRLAVIYYGIEDDLHDAEPDVDLDGVRAARAAGRHVVCCIGSVGARQHQRLLVEAIAFLPPELRPICLMIGEGDIESFASVARELQVEEHIRCLGYKRHPRALLRESEWLVLPSTSDGMPLAVLEAFADRVPVVTSDIPEFAEMIDDGRNGLLFESNNARALASRLRMAITMPVDRRQRMTDAAHKNFDERHRLETMVRAYELEYQALLAAGSDAKSPSCAA
jgi:glycosyltransferase involved in cell wall biosynthesis